VALAGCGGGGSNTTASVSTTSRTLSASLSVATSGSETVSRVTSSTSTSAEQQSGDETPISTQALFTGRGGKITPRKVEVPPFIAVTVVLRSADGKTYSIEANGHGMATNGRARLKLPGLRAEKRYVIKNNSGTPATLIIEANAEPGP
jgi:hypothetical protein